MDFTQAESEALKWVTTSKTRFEVIDSDPSAKRLVFASNTGEDSFYVVGPNIENGVTSWHVWSDDADVLSRIALVIDSLQSCKERKLTDILKSINKALAEKQGGAAAVEAEEDEIEEDSCDSDEDYDDSYYAEDDHDVENDGPSQATEDEDEDSSMYTKQGSVTAVKRLLKDWKNMKGAEKFGIVACPRESNLFVWDVKLKDFPKGSRLAKDLNEYSKNYKTEPVISMEMLFPQDYPMAPPFVRIVRPRFQFLTGHITIGGSICMELLTKSGWRPTNDIENLVVQIRSEIISDDKAALDKRNANNPYDKVEAQRAFQRMVQRYGWDK